MESIRNRLKCTLCNDLIESVTRHDFKYCQCGAIFVDGGRDYFRCGGNFENIIVVYDDGSEKPLVEIGSCDTSASPEGVLDENKREVLTREELLNIVRIQEDVIRQLEKRIDELEEVKKMTLEEERKLYEAFCEKLKKQDTVSTVDRELLRKLEKRDKAHQLFIDAVSQD